MRHFHDPAGSDETNDPAGWNRASYESHPVDFLEPLADEPNGYRQAAIHYLGIIYAVDQFLSEAEDSRLAVVACAVVLGWPSARGLSITDIAGQLGCAPATLTRSIARFKTLAGLDSAGGIQGIRPGAGSLNGDKPAAIQSLGNIPQEPGPIAW